MLLDKRTGCAVFAALLVGFFWHDSPHSVARAALSDYVEHAWTRRCSGTQRRQ